MRDILLPRLAQYVSLVLVCQSHILRSDQRSLISENRYDRVIKSSLNIPEAIFCCDCNVRVERMKSYDVRGLRTPGVKHLGL